jgi:benzoyl-CoA 2,3-dioxygenase component B
MRLRDDYTQDCVKGSCAGTRSLRSPAMTQADAAERRLPPPIGEFKGVHATPDGVLIDDATWNRRR